MNQGSLFPDNQFRDPNKLREFMLAGKSKITVRSDKTLKHYTYKIKKEKDGKVWYVSRLSANNEYRYLGSIFSDEQMNFRTTRKTASYDHYSEAWSAFEWLWKYIRRSVMPMNVTVFHEGRCGMCGLELTDPVSIKEGYGPDCRKKKLSRSFYC